MEAFTTGLPTHFDPSTCATLVEVLQKRALYQPDQRAYIFLANGEVAEERTMTYAELDSKARAIAALLQSMCAPGARVLLLYPSGLDYIAAFFGCLYAGVIAVPAYPPSSNRLVHRILTITVDAGAKLALTTDAVMTKMLAWSKQTPELAEVQWIATDAIETAADQWQPYTPTARDLAFFQYTSGSTGHPKGVMVSHGNLMHNSEMIRKHCHHTSESVGVSWLPMFHDAGLIEGVLQPLYVGYLAVLMAPASFIQRPLRWLEAISHYRGTTTEAPNFAYELCVTRSTEEERARLNLQSWLMAANGAEPVRAATLKRFMATFAPCGLPKTAMTPAYGLAETTLLVSCVAVDVEETVLHLDKSQLEQNRILVKSASEPSKTVDIVGCGIVVAKDQRVVIANPESMQASAPDEIGEIWVSGPSMAQGYWQHPVETENTFRAYLQDTLEGPFVRTGDLGFLYDGQVFVTGRLKDMVIIRGHNYYPQDIELTAERSHPSLRPGCGAAFSIEVGDAEQLVVIQEVARHFEEPERIIEAIRLAIAEEYEIKVHTVVLIRYGSILKTSSGKIQRRACRAAFLEEELAVVASHALEDAPSAQGQMEPERQQTFLRQLEQATPTQKRELLLALVTRQVYTVLSAQPEQGITPEQNLLSLGIDSLTGTQLMNRLQTLLDRPLPNLLTLMMSEPTINKLADHLISELFPQAVATRSLMDTYAPATNGHSAQQTTTRDMEPANPSREKNMQFSLLYFASDEAASSGNKYELLVEGAKFADEHQFTAVWIPERHFHPFGGLYPNPSVLASALAMVTKKIRLRAGSVVLPMHHPARVAEEWSVVDNLSAGRVDLAFAIGWNPNDFALAPTNFANRKEVFFAGIETFQKLWRGDAISVPNGLGKETAIKIYPLPKQPALTPWITCTGSPERFSEAGAMGANILTGLLFQSLEELAEKIKVYREARARHGYDPATGHVTLMLHTFVGEDMDEVRQKVRQPFIEYLKSSVDLWRNQWDELNTLTTYNQEQVLAYAFERYFQTHGLFGTPQTCKKMVDSLSAAGIDEIASLIDFGLDVDTVMDGLYSLNALRKRCQRNNQTPSTDVAAQVTTPNVAAATIPSNVTASIPTPPIPIPTPQPSQPSHSMHPSQPSQPSHPSQLPALRPMPRDQALPLSFAQQRLWFVEQLNPETSLYNEHMAIRLTGALNSNALELSFSEIIRRHEILRTTFIDVDNETRQHIAPWQPQKLVITDLQDLPVENREAHARRMAEAKIEQPLDFVNGPLFKVQLFQLTATDHLLLVIFHQAIGDGWSMGVLLKELSALYKAYQVGAASPLAELPLQYADYTLWQQERLQGAVLQEQLDYWRQQLRDPPAQLNLPTDRPHPLAPTNAGNQQVVLLPPALLHQLKALGQRESATLFVTLLTAFYILLMRYSGQQDILVGSPIANRTRRELEDLIGFFVNTLVLRADLSGNPSFQQLLRRVREMTLQAYAHQDLPFEKLVAQLETPRDLNHQPLFQVAFVLQNFPFSALTLPGVSWNLLELATTTAKFDLVMTLSEEKDGLLTKLEYSTDLFDAPTIARFLGHWQVLLAAIVADTSKPIAYLPLLTTAEHELIMHTSDAIYQDVHPHLGPQQVFEQQAAQTPDSIAVVFEQTAMTYRELNTRANQLAHYLRSPHVDASANGTSQHKQGVGPETLVALFLERSIEMIVAILGTLKAGGAFMPLDPTYPQERLAYMLEDAPVSILLTQQHLLPRLPEHAIPVVCLNVQREAIATEKATNPSSQTSADNLAYVIYTSGSTGKPKGVMLPQRGICNLARAQIATFAVAPGSRVLQFASFSFDAFIAEIFMALLSGATLHMVTQDALLPGPDLFRLFYEQAISVVTLPPTVLALFPPAMEHTLQTLIVAGEVCPEDIVREWSSRTHFFNAYGPTEATVCATSTQATAELQKASCIGRPLANVEVYLLDAHLQPVPLGVPGKLYIGGVGLAHGYIKRADLTAERFIPHPFSAQGGKRLYDTGDLACYQPDGSLVFIGRADRQVKLRGFRVEPQEIEAVLNSHRAIKQSSLVLQENSTGKHLTAFVVLDQEQNAANRQTELWPSVAEYFIYDELLYFAMTHDERRNDSYKVAINRLVKDKIVVDIGTGKDAILSRFCVEGGAKHVYAIEILADVYEQARNTIQSLGLEEKITIIHSDATKVQLPELADVCVSEIVGSIGGSEGAAFLINDAQRFLKPDGVMIPTRSVTKIAAFSLPPDLAADPGFTTQTATYVEKIFAHVGYQFDLRLCVKNLSYDDIASSTGIFEDLDFTGHIDPNYCQEMELIIDKQAKIDGFLVWLNLYTIAGEEIDILQEEFCWLPVYLPAFYPGIEVAEGDRIHMTCRGSLSENQLNPDYALKGQILKQNGETIPFEYTAYHYKQIFRENTFYRELFAQDSIKVQGPKAPSWQSVDELRSFLRERLPAYMLPATFVTIDALPLTPAGKVDLQALSQYQDGPTQPPYAPYMPPRTETEQAIVKIWQEVLELERVGIHDNLFDLGGHSLLLVRIHDSLLATLNKDVPIIDLFTYPTISSLTAHINQEVQGQDEEEIIQQSYDRAERRTTRQRHRQTTRRAALLEEEEEYGDE